MVARSVKGANDYITRAECVAMINHALNRLIREVAPTEPAPPSTETAPPHTFTLGTPCD